MRDSIFSILNLLMIGGGAFVLSIIINRFMLKFAHTLGIRNKNDVTIRWSLTSKPSLGGISFYIIFLAGFMFYAIFYGQEDVFKNQSLLGLFYAVSVAFLLGLSDDAYDTKPVIKLLLQIACGLILIKTNNAISIFDSELANYALTILWIVGIMNSINMLDNMDGITTITSISIITGIIFILVPFTISNNIDIFLLITSIGTLFGFLAFNHPPAKMFMGDTGSQFLGVFLAYFSIKYLWNNDVNEQTMSAFANISLVITAFSVPLMDTAIVSINRLLRKQSPLVGGKDHTTHHLVYKGFSEVSVFYIYSLLGVFSSILTFVFQRYIPNNSYSYSFLWIYFIVLFLTFFILTRKQKSIINDA
ncbi:MAG: MraY family glycosyltransferase [Putridiphycobacter sp.]|nr:MraY family glycosyltransferase [Putridiphycobacter sp.]